MSKLGLLSLIFAAAGSSAAFAGQTYDCKVSQYSVEDKPYGKGTTTQCGTVTLSDDNSDNNPRYQEFPNCGHIALSVSDLSTIGGYSVELAEVRQGREGAWGTGDQDKNSSFTVEKAEDMPKHFSISLGDLKSKTLGTGAAIEYTAECTKR
jgi:hypothetical protein